MKRVKVVLIAEVALLMILAIIFYFMGLGELSKAILIAGSIVVVLPTVISGIYVKVKNKS